MGEFDLIEQLRAALPTRGGLVRLGSGDDAAITEPRGRTATSVDAIVEGVHFTRPAYSPEAIGHKALAAALSDLAAMGADAGEAYVVLGLPADEPEEVTLGIAEGIGRLARATGTVVAGGDITRSPVLSVTVTVVGHEDPANWLVSRAGARAGDVVALTGELGGAAAALRLLGGSAAAEPPSRTAILARQLAPDPRLAAGRALADAGATAMIDISDGLGADALHLAEASHAGIEIDMRAVPIQTGVREIAGSEDAGFELAASGGEDYELLACLPPASFEDAAAAVERCGTKLTAIGLVSAPGSSGPGIVIRNGDDTIQPSGFDHRS